MLYIRIHALKNPIKEADRLWGELLNRTNVNKFKRVEINILRNGRWKEFRRVIYKLNGLANYNIF